MSAELPRVTIVSMNPICAGQANGMLMSSLFDGWPRERLAQVYFPVLTSHRPDLNVCGESRSIRIWGTVSRDHARTTECKFSSSAAQNTRKGESALLRRSVSAFTRRRRLMQWIRPCLEAWCIAVPLDRVLERQLRELRPECVYALVGNFWLTRAIARACNRLHLPYYLHATDDYVSALYRNAPFARTFQRSSDSWFRRAVKGSFGRAAISPIMSEEFTRRYGKQWNWFTTLIDSAAYDPTPPPSDDTIRFVFAGNLGLDRWRVLRQLSISLYELCREMGVQSTLDVYAPTDQLNAHRHALEGSPILKVKGWLPPSSLPNMFRDADVLVHVESFDPIISDYTKLSFSTKLSQYMMAGRCILGVGPAQLGSMQIIRRLAAGAILPDLGPSSVAAALRPLLQDADLRRRLGENGRRWAVDWCDSNVGRLRFRQDLMAAVERSRVCKSAA